MCSTEQTHLICAMTSCLGTRTDFFGRRMQGSGISSCFCCLCLYALELVWGSRPWIQLPCKHAMEVSWRFVTILARTTHPFDKTKAAVKLARNAAGLKSGWLFGPCRSPPPVLSSPPLPCLRIGPLLSSPPWGKVRCVAREWAFQTCRGKGTPEQKNNSRGHQKKHKLALRTPSGFHGCVCDSMMLPCGRHLSSPFLLPLPSSSPPPTLTHTLPFSPSSGHQGEGLLETGSMCSSETYKIYLTSKVFGN